MSPRTSQEAAAVPSPVCPHNDEAARSAASLRAEKTLRAFVALLTFLALLSVFGVCLSGSAPGAPAPTARSHRHEPAPTLGRALVGEWTMCWGGSSYRATLSPNGRYRAEGYGSVYAGRWWAQAPHTLRVVEWREGQGGEGFRWAAQIDPATLRGGVGFPWRAEEGWYVASRVSFGPP